MGFSISGLILTENFNREVSKVSENLEIGIEVLKKVESSWATIRIEDEKEIYLGFNEEATIIYYEPSLYDQKIYSQTTNSLNFQYFEGPMIFALRYVKDCELKRRILSIDGDELLSIGRKLKVETQTDRIESIVIDFAKQISNFNILRLTKETSVYQCRIKEYTGPKIRKSEKEINAMLTERSISRNFKVGYDDLFQ